MPLDNKVDIYSPQKLKLIVAPSAREKLSVLLYEYILYHRSIIESNYKEKYPMFESYEEFKNIKNVKGEANTKKANHSYNLRSQGNQQDQQDQGNAEKKTIKKYISMGDKGKKYICNIFNIFIAEIIRALISKESLYGPYLGDLDDYCTIRSHLKCTVSPFILNSVQDYEKRFESLYNDAMSNGTKANLDNIKKLLHQIDKDHEAIFDDAFDIFTKFLFILAWYINNIVWEKGKLTLDDTLVKGCLRCIGETTNHYLYDYIESFMDLYPEKKPAEPVEPAEHAETEEVAETDEATEK